MAFTNEIRLYLAASDLPLPHPAWLNALLGNQRANTSLNSLKATAKHRLLAANICLPNTLDPSNAFFPANLTNPAVRELKLSNAVHVQVLGIEDLSKSRWEQIEAIEAFEKGETTRGREIIRLAPGGEDEDEGPRVRQASALGAQGTSNGPHRLVLQDWKGQRVYGVELRSVEGVGLGMSIGAKLLLKNVTVARGMILLEPGKITVLGGKVEAMHKEWTKNRKKELREAIGAEGGPA